MDSPSDNKVDTKDLRSVTLLVTPQQANLLYLGREGMSLMLRNDTWRVATRTTGGRRRCPRPRSRIPRAGISAEKSARVPS